MSDTNNTRLGWILHVYKIDGSMDTTNLADVDNSHENLGVGNTSFFAFCSELGSLNVKMCI